MIEQQFDEGSKISNYDIHMCYFVPFCTRFVLLSTFYFKTTVCDSLQAFDYGITSDSVYEK